MTYEEKCRLLGIERPKSLAQRFEDDRPSTAISKEVLRKQVGARMAGKPLEDLTHLNPSSGDRAAQNSRNWWKNLPPEQKARLAKERGKRFEGRNYKKNWWRADPRT